MRKLNNDLKFDIFATVALSLGTGLLWGSILISYLFSNSSESAIFKGLIKSLLPLGVADLACVAACIYNLIRDIHSFCCSH